MQATDAAGPRHDAKLEKARKQVAVIKGFYIHLVVFVVVNLGLCAVNFVTGKPWWVLWVFLGWGLGVLAHAFGVYGHASNSIAQWEERKIKKLMEEN
jgi:hypothetical protein